MKFIRQRYILFEIIVPEQYINHQITKDDILKEIWNQVSTLFGQKVSFRAGLWMIRWDPVHRIGILRCDNITKLEIIASATFITKIQNIPVIFHSRKTSGTVKKTLKKWREHFSIEPPKREI